MRSRLDAAVQGCFATFHAKDIAEVIRTVRERPVQAVLVSPACVTSDELPRVASLVDGFPGIPTVALISRHDSRSSERLLELGAYGVRKMIDLSQRNGWQCLRDLVSHPTSPTAARIFRRLNPALDSATYDCRTVFESVVRVAPAVTTAAGLAEHFSVVSSTFTSRFLRAGLPSPKRYLAGTRILYAAALFEVPGLSVADVAYRLQYSSPQSFGRHLRNVMGMTAGEFRVRFSFELALDDFVRRLVDPFRATFRTFHPLNPGVGYLGQTW
ncbi:MAG: helix-turn-helix transcriptional regulator [Gemmatimonadota bacterium]|nr:MAG: helix-turn-helix transcriptional regulator [Gemmatimonadota bacterium]